VVSAAEEAWNDMTSRLDTVAADLHGIDPLGDEDLAAQVSEVPADRTDLHARVAALDTLLAGGRWTRLSAEFDLLERELASAAGNFRATERAVVALLSRRDELRGLLDAYQAKAARLGAAEDPHLAARCAQARELLWTAPCDLTAVASAVNGYQQAVLAIGARQR
jgi:hypothetical protein